MIIKNHSSIGGNRQNLDENRNDQEGIIRILTFSYPQRVYLLFYSFLTTLLQSTIKYLLKKNIVLHQFIIASNHRNQLSKCMIPGAMLRCFIEWHIFHMIRLEKHSKREARHSKILQKELEDLRKGEESMDRTAREQRPEDAEDPDDVYIDRKGKQWWQRFDDRHFPTLPLDKYKALRELTTSQALLQIQPKDPILPGSFHQLEVMPLYDLLAEPDLLHVLFKTQSPARRLLASYAVDPSAPSEQMCPSVLGFKVTPQSQAPCPQSPLPFKLTLAGYNEDEQTCRALSQYKRRSGRCKGSLLQKQLKLWEKELQTVNQSNRKGWRHVLKSIEMNSKNGSEGVGEGEVTEIRDVLTWSTVLKCFLLGHADKTEEQLTQLLQSQRSLKPAKSKDGGRKFFETDCKICFCSANQDSNQVLYCDSCNTSFHLACYGLPALPPEDPYFCDPCAALKLQPSRPLNCQLCCKPKFPIKNLQGHYYHLTCLFLLNLGTHSNNAVAIKQGGLVLREKTHQQILQMVVDSELNLQDCQYCGSGQGMRLECRQKGCKINAHPICAYINGCSFHLQRQGHQLKSTFTCNHHDESRDWVEQTYLRRYMCNFKRTSQLSLPLFRQAYKQQISKTTQDRQIPTIPEKIIQKTRFLKRRIANEQQKSAQNKEVMTETRKYLEKLKKKM